MTLNLRIAKLEDELDQDDDGPSLSDRLHHALTEARSRRGKGLPAQPFNDPDHPLAERWHRAMERADRLRAWAARGSREGLEMPRNGAGSEGIASQ
jgi:hypothetical protein